MVVAILILWSKGHSQEVEESLFYWTLTVMCQVLYVWSSFTLKSVYKLCVQYFHFADKRDDNQRSEITF